MNAESRIAIAIVLAAAIIGAAVMIRDANVTGFAAGGANLPPTYTAASTKYAMAVNTPLALSLPALFQDPEGQPLTFLATQSKDISVDITGDTLTITPAPGFQGERIVTVIASDGAQTANKRLKIEVGSAPIEPPAEQEFVPASPPAQTPPPVPPGQAKKPEIEAALEEALDTESEVPAIIILKRQSAFGTLAERGRLRKEALEERKRLAKEARVAFKEAQEAAEITGASVLGTNGLTVVHEYDTVNAIAVRLTRQALNKLKNDDTIAKILLDRELTTGLADTIPLIDADDVWNLTAGGANVTGQNETICILDTGIDFSHPAFVNKIVGGYDYVNEDNSPQDDASNSHGTHVAGIAAGNSSAVRGVAKDAKIVPVKVCNSANSCTASDILAGIDYCNNNSVAFNISVMSISIGDNSQYNSSTCPTLFDDALNTSVSLGIITAVASGNNGFTAGISYPACSPYVISVGSTTKADAMSSFTNRGGDRLDVLAPGSSIVSSVIGGGTGTLSGTSMATPHASGTIALVQQNQKSQGKPQLSLPEMRALLIETGKLVTSWNRVDVLAAVVQMNHNYTINLTDNSVTNRTPPKAKVKFKDGADFSHIVDCAQLKHNFVEIDSAACPQYNKSAHIVFEGLPGINATPLRNGEPCPASICQNVTFSGGTLEFDVTSFTNFSSESEFSTQDVITNCDPGPVVMNTSTTLTNSISSNGTCIVTNATGITLDCDGFTIGFNANGSGAIVEAGINLTRSSGVTIRDCIINDLNNTGTIGDAGILFDVSNYSIVNNVTITANASSTVYFSGSHNVTLANSTFVNGGVIDGPAVRESNITGNFLNVSSISFTGTGNLIAFNTFSSNASTIIQNSGNARILYNNATIRTSVNGPRGIDTDPAGPFEITGNRMFVHTTGTSPQAFRFAASSGNISNNTFLANGTGARGISIQATAAGTFSGNNFTVMGASSAAIEFLFAVVNTTRFTDTVISSEAAFIDLNADTATSIINFTNTTFVMPNGSINIIGLAQLNGSKNVTVAKLNITANRAFLNSSNLTFLNQTGIIALEDVTFSDPKPQFDFEDDGTFADCTSTANPFCTEISYTGGTFVFNTSHFTTFQSADSTVNLTGCATINSSATLVNNITSTGTCIVVNANNITLNCNGFNILYGASSSGIVSSNGIVAAGRTNITIRDCLIRDINQNGSADYGINLTATNSSFIINNTIHTNGTQSHGIALSLNSSANHIANNNITAGGNSSSQSSHGIGLSGSGNTATNNIIITRGAGDNNGIAITGSYNHVSNNDITAANSTSSNFNFGIHITFTAANWNNATNNTIRTHGTTNNHGIFVDNGANSSTLVNNNITARGTVSGNYGILIDESSGNIVINNTISTNGTTTNYGIALEIASGHNTFANNDISTGGSGSSNFGIYVSASVNNTFSNSTIRTNGTTNNYGIFLQSTSQNNTFTDTNISTSGTSSYGIFSSATTLESSFRNTLLSNTIEWIFYSASSTVHLNLTNTTFAMPSGSIAVTGLAQLNRSQNVTRIKLNITNNRAFLNSTNLTFFNTTAIITLNDLTFGDPSPTVDYEDDGTFVACGADCTEISFSGGVYVFNVSHFTSFSSSDAGGVNASLLKIDTPDPVSVLNELNYTITVNITSGNASNITLTDTYPPQVIFLTAQPAPITGTNNTFIVGNLTENQTFIVNISVSVRKILNGTRINNTANISFQNESGGLLNLSVTANTTVLGPIGIDGCPVTINQSSMATQNMSSAVTCVTFGTDNLELDCNGFNITYGTSTDSEVFGVNISNRFNASVYNCGIFKGSSSGARTYGIAFLNTSGGIFANNTIRTNGTEENDGIHTGVATSVNITFTPSTTTIVTNDGNVNNPFCTNATGVSLCQVCFDTAGVNCAVLGQSGCADGEGYKFDDILRFNVSNTTNISSGNIQVIGGEAVFCNLNGNTTISFGTRNNCGSFRSSTFSGAFFVPGAENNLTCAVAGGGKDEDNGFKLVSFSYEGVTQTATLIISGNSTNLTATRNTIVADGGVNSRGIFLDAHNSDIRFNVITTAGGNESHGIALGSENTTVASNNITTTDGGKSRGVTVIAPFSNVTGNNIRIIGPSEEREGILVLSNRTNLLFNNISTQSGRFSHGIHVLGALFVNATGNNISVGAGNGSHGILLAAANASVALNNVSVNTSSLSHGITLPGSIAAGNAITGNVIRANSRGSNALNVFFATGNTFSNNEVILANQSSAYLDHALANTFSGSFLPVFGSALFILQDNGSINYTQALNVSASTLLSQVVSIGHNRTLVNATGPGGAQLNGTAVLRFFSLPGDGVIPVFDDADDGTFDVCPGGRCRNTSYNQSTGQLQYNVTHFTTYAAQEVSACATIDNLENATTVNVTLTNNVTSTIDCFTIVAENATFTCNGFPIFFDSAGAGGDGIIVEHTNNIVIRDCVIRDVTFGGNGSIGINITNTSNVTLINNTIFTNGTNNNYGILARAFNATVHTNFTFINNTVRARGSVNNNTGIHIQGGNITKVLIINNTIDTNGTDSNDGIRLATLFTGHSFIHDVRVIQNSITTNGSFRNNGLFVGQYLSSTAGNVHHLVIANNTIRTFGTSTINNGLYLLGTANNVTILQNNISINSSSSSSSGIFFETFASSSVIENNTIHNNSIRTRVASGGGIGIELQDFSGGRMRNYTVTYNDIITNGSSTNYGMELTGVVNAVIENNTVVSGGSSTSNRGILLTTSFANITAYNNLINTTGAGSGYGIEASGGLTPTNITIARNNISTGNRPGGTITGDNNRGISFSSVTNSFVLDNFIYTNGTFNNTGIFIGDSCSFNIIANNTIVTGGNESGNAGIGLILVSGNFGNIASNNVTNNTINSTGFGRSPSIDVGILLQGLGNGGASVTTNTIRINKVHARGNDSDNFGVFLAGTVTFNNITENQILTNGTDRNHGIFAMSPSTSFQTTDNIIEWNNITAWGIASTDNYGIFLHNLVVRYNITDNNVTTRGSDRNHGVFINASSNNNRVERNNFTLETFGTDNIGAVIEGSANNTLRNNFIQTNTSALDKGIVLRSSARSNRISNNTIRTNGTVLTLSLSHTNVIEDQNVTANSFAGALLLAAAQHNNFTNVIVASDRGITTEFLPGAGDGAFFDGFEDGTIAPFTTSGNAPWLINNTNVSSGSFSAQAADINDSQSATISLALTAGAGTISFARKVSSESGFDFLTFYIDGSSQQQWSGNLDFATFNFSFNSANTFTWTYSKDSSVSSGLDTAWIDNVNISFAGNGSINNTFNKTFFLTNNTWLFIGENNTNNTVQNTTFTGTNGSLTIVPVVHIAPVANATISRLNNSHNLTFLNSNNLTFFNTAAILRFLQILFIDPAPFRDREDDGTFTYCPPSVCAELSYANNEFAHNTTGFSFYTVGEGQVNLTINKTDSPDPVPASSQLNYTIIVNNSGSSTAFNLTLLEIYPNEVIFLSAQPTPEAGTNNTFFIGNFTPESQIQLNITVFVRNITADSVINNTINATFLNQSNATIRANVTENTTVTNPAVLNMSSISVTKHDNPDPVNASQNLTYVINVTGTGPGISRNVSVNDTYPNEVIFLTAQPAPITGTNNTFFLGNITNGTSVIINITVLVRNITNGTVINNSANATFQNNTNFTFTEVATASTTVNNPPQINASAITVSKADSPDPVSAGAQLNYTVTVTSTGGATAFNVTVNETYPSSVVFDSAQPAPAVGNTTFILGNLTPGTVVVINITVNVSSGASGTITNIVNATFQNETGGVNLASDSEGTSVTAAAAPAAGSGGGGGYTTPTPRSVFPLEQPTQVEGDCIESWACEAWSQCVDGSQVRTCVDLSQCNTTNYLPVTKRACEMPLPEVVQPEPEPLVLPELQPERLEPEVELPRWTLCTILPIGIDAMLVFLAALTLVLVFLTREQRAKSHLKRAADIAMIATLVLLLAHYAACGEFLPWQYVAFVILAAFLLLIRMSERLGEKKVNAERAPKPSEAPLPKPAQVAAIRPVKAKSPEPAHDEADMQDVFRALDRSAKVLEKFRQTVKKGKKIRMVE